MIRIYTPNQQAIVRYLKEHGSAVYTDLEPLIDSTANAYWATFSCISGLIQMGIVSMSDHPATYRLTKYGKDLVI